STPTWIRGSGRSSATPGRFPSCCSFNQEKSEQEATEETENCTLVSLLPLLPPVPIRSQGAFHDSHSQRDLRCCGCCCGPAAGAGGETHQALDRVCFLPRAAETSEHLLLRARWRLHRQDHWLGRHAAGDGQRRPSPVVEPRRQALCIHP